MKRTSAERASGRERATLRHVRRHVGRLHPLSITLAVTLAATGFSQQAEPGSLLVMPEFDNHSGNDSFLTVTNVNPTEGVETVWVYVNGQDCLQYERIEYLDPLDTLTLLTSFHNYHPWRGFVYVYARSPQTQEPISFNWLTGACMSINGIDTFGFSARPVVFRSNVPHGESTDLDGDGIRDFNGLEYQMLPDQLLFPRFLGQQYGALESDLILINLTGTVYFTADILVELWNDNSQQFNTYFSFACWTRAPLTAVSSAAVNTFLAATNNDPLEILGDPQWEAGWFSIDGIQAGSETQTIVDPGLLAILVERFGTHESAVAPFGRGMQNNGGLINDDSFIDLEPGVKFCFGDRGQGTPCPCNNDNDGSIPFSGCANGVFASGAHLSALGEARVSADTLKLKVGHAEPSNACLFFKGDNRVNGGDGLVFGDGLRCAGGGVVRLQVVFTNSLGVALTTIAIGAKTGAEAGDIQRYQCWYRSVLSPACGPLNFFNTSNGYELMWMP